MKKENMDKKFQLAAHEAQARLLEAAALEGKEAMARYGTGASGLTEEQAEASRDKYGANKVTREKKKSVAARLVEAFVNPFTVILFVLAGVSTVTDIILPLPGMYFGFLALVVAGYMLLTTSIKKAYIRHYGSLL